MTPDFKLRLAQMSAALWWGSMTLLGVVVVPQLFAYLPTPAIAGGVAAKLFSTQTAVSVGCGLLILLCCVKKEGQVQAGWSFDAIAFASAGLLLSLLLEFAVAPRILSRENLKLWHAVGMILFFGQGLNAGLLLWKLLGARR